MDCGELSTRVSGRGQRRGRRKLTESCEQTKSGRNTADISSTPLTSFAATCGLTNMRTWVGNRLGVVTIRFNNRLGVHIEFR
eukprot:5416725-Pyramimonas_sp.AAC.3